MSAEHFRKRAAEARALSRLGEDVRLCAMLLQVAEDLEAEAAAIEAEGNRAGLVRLRTELRFDPPVPVFEEAGEADVQLDMRYRGGQTVTRRAG